MATRGRPKKDARQKTRQSARSPRQKLSTPAAPGVEFDAIPAPPSADPKPILLGPPKWLSKGAKELWVESQDDIIATKAFHRLDLHALGRFFQWLAYAIKLEKALGGELLFNHPANNHKIQKPEVALAIRAWEQVAKAAEQCGFSLAARRKLGIKLPDGDAIAGSAGTEPKPDGGKPDPHKAWVFDGGSRP